MGKKVILAGAALVVVAVAALVVVAVSLGFFWPFGRHIDTMQLPGVVEIQEVRLGSKIGGRVEKADPLLEGTIAEAGQVLVTIEVPELKAQYEQAQGQLVAAQANLDLTKDQYERAQKLFPSRAIGEEEYRQRELSYQQARGQLTQVEGRVRELDANLSEAEVRRRSALWSRSWLSARAIW